MPLFLLNRDITRMKTDAIVNAANPDLIMGGGVCGAIFRAAGPDKMARACASLAPISTGSAVITPGFALPAKFVIHTPGPIYRAHQADLCRMQLRSCYLNSLALAEEKGCGSIAFPLISAGIYGYPREEALQVAEESIREYLRSSEMDVYLLLREKSTRDPRLMVRIKAYLDSLLPDESPSSVYLENIRFGFSSERNPRQSPTRRYPAKACESTVPPSCDMDEAPSSRPSGLDRWIDDLDESFSQTLLRLIDAKGRTDVDVYRGANLDRRLFSKIRADKGYMPSKRTALALAISLQLSLEETEDLLRRAGFALSRSQKFDAIVRFFLLQRIYDLDLINETLFQYDQPLLGS